MQTQHTATHPQVYSSLDNVAGVKIPKFESVSQPGDTKMDLTGERGQL